jgi:tRNA A-37 threonylcarbamoyl transferase component Bud32
MLELSPVSHLENCIKTTTTKNVGESIGKMHKQKSMKVADKKIKPKISQATKG